MAFRRCGSRIISLRLTPRGFCTSVKEASGWDEQLTLSNLGFRDDGDEHVLEDPDGSSKKLETNVVIKKRHIHSNSRVPKRSDADSTSPAPVRPTPAEMKQAALEACNILASIAGMQLPRAKRLANEQLSELPTKHVFDARSKKVVEVAVRQVEEVGEELREQEEAEALEHASMEVVVGEEHEQANLVPHHPWPAWMEFLEHLHAKGCFEGTEDGMEEDKSIFESTACVRHAVCAFGRHRADIFKSLSRKDLRVLANYGCPDIERKASNASKRLREHFRILEGEVCLRCSLKMSCPRAFLAPAAKLPVTTLDVLRIIAGFATNAWPNADSCTSYPKELESAILKLLKELLTYSELPVETVKGNEAEEKGSSLERSPLKKAVVYPPSAEQMPGDWSCPNCQFMNFNRNKRCRECHIFRPPDEEKLLLGDWVCPKCQYANFSKNGFCRICKTERPTKAQWLGGERLPDGASSKEPQGELEEPTKRASSSTQKGKAAKNTKARGKTPRKLEKLGEKQYEASDEEGFEVRALANYGRKADSGSEMDFSEEERALLQGRSAIPNRRTSKPLFRWDNDDVKVVPKKGKTAVMAPSNAPKPLKNNLKPIKVKPEPSRKSKPSKGKPIRN